jgi:predicted nucleic acid-binding protein
VTAGGDLEAFVDTNVLVYAVSVDEGAKHRTAAELVRRGFAQGCFAISSQVMLELYVTVTRKIVQPLSPGEALEYVEALTEWRIVEQTPDLVLAALALADRAQVSPWDAAILEAARRAGCRRVLSEDLSHGVDYGGIVVENPFDG